MPRPRVRVSPFRYFNSSPEVMCWSTSIGKMSLPTPRSFSHSLLSGVW